MTRSKKRSTFLKVSCALLLLIPNHFAFANERSTQISEVPDIPICDVIVNGPLAPGEIDIAYRAMLACLETRLADEDIGESSMSFGLLNKILVSKADSGLKLEAVTSYSNRASKSETGSLIKSLDRKLFYILSRNINLCAGDYRACDHIIHSALGTVHIFPETISKIADSLLAIFKNSGYGVLTDSLASRTKALKVLSTFYSSTTLSFFGDQPKWKVPTDEQQAITDDIIKNAGELIGFSRVFSVEALQKFIPHEYTEYYNISLSHRDIIDLSKKFNESLHQLGNVLASIAIYTERLGKTDIKPWIGEYVSRCKSDQNSCFRFVNALILFGEYEVKLPQRQVYVETLATFSHLDPVIADYSRFLSSISTQIDESNIKFAKTTGLERTTEYEAELQINYPDFSSFLYQSHILMNNADRISASAQIYKGDPSKGNQVKYENDISQYERRWFALTCASLRIAQKNHKLKHPMLGTIKLPFSEEEIARERCVGGDTLAAIEREYDLNAKFIRGIRPLKSGIIYTAAIAATVLSAGLSTVGESAAALTVRAATIAARSRIFSGFNAVRAISSAGIFTTSMKVFSAAAGLAPLWVQGQGVYGNFIKPWFTASVIFFFMPATAVASAFLGKAMLSAKASRRLVAFTTGGIELTVNTVAFGGIEYAHRTLEKLTGQRKVIFSGDMGSVGFDSFIYAAAFYVVFSRMRVPTSEFIKVEN